MRARTSRPAAGPRVTSTSSTRPAARKPVVQPTPLQRDHRPPPPVTWKRAGRRGTRLRSLALYGRTYSQMYRKAPRPKAWMSGVPHSHRLGVDGRPGPPLHEQPGPRVAGDRAGGLLKEKDNKLTAKLTGFDDSGEISLRDIVLHYKLA